MAAAAPGHERFRLILWALVAVVAVAATAMFLFRPVQQPAGVTGTPFSLQSTEGGTFDNASLVGAPSLVFFGYTFCPDVCPTTLAESTAWRDALGLTAEQLRIVFVSVDPTRDTLDEMRSYLSGFQSPIIGLTGSEADVAAARRSFGVFSEIVGDVAAGDYLVNHTASVFMMGADGQFEGTIAYGEAMEAALDKLRRLVGLPAA